MSSRPASAVALLLVVGTAAGASAPTTALASDVGYDWRAAFAIALPEPVRTLIMREGEDANAFVLEHGLDAARVVPLGGGTAVVEAPMSDERWAQAQQTLCADARVAGCESAVCQSIQLAGAVDAGARSADQVQARILRNPPESPPVIDDEALVDGSCRGTPPLVPPEGEAGAAAVGDLHVDLSLAGEANGQDGTRAGAGADASAPAVAPVARRAFEFSLAKTPTGPNALELGTDTLPEDTSDWTMVVNAGCSEVRVPLDSVEPARAPGLVTAVVASGTSAAVAAQAGLTVVRELSLVTTSETLAVFATTGEIGQALAALALDTRVTGAQPEYVYRTTAVAGGTRAGYSDPLAMLTYGPRLTGAEYLHPATRGAGELVAVIDTGVAREHPEFAGRVREGVDVTDRGWSADAHGTAVVGIIAAEANNGVGSFGVAPGVDVLPVKACQPKEPGGVGARCWTSTLVKALDVAIQADARLINMSLSGPPDPLVERYVRIALEQDRLIVAGAGNGGPAAKPGYPAAIPGVLAVTAVDAWSRLYREANLGAYVDLAAPGVDIVSPTPEGNFPVLSGTSMAAAHVTGVAALIGALVPALGGAEIAAILTRSARDLGDPGADARFGAGLLDACGAAGSATLDAVTCVREGGVVGGADAVQAD